MRVRLGWSGEVEPNVWRKVDVTMEEEDLRRMMTESGLPTALHEKIPTALCFALLEAEAETHLLGKLTRSVGYPGAQSSVRIRDLTATKDGILHALKEKVAAHG